MEGIHMTGIIVAVCTSSQGGVPKYPQDQVTLTSFGFAGDYHCKPMRESFSKPGTQKANTDRHITIVGKEAIDAVNAKLGITLGIGALGENILTEGLHDLSNVVPHTTIRIGESEAFQLVEFRVVEQNQPCHNLVHYHRHFNKEIYGRRGLLCAVVRGEGVIIRANYTISIHPARCTECGDNNMAHAAMEHQWLCFKCNHVINYQR